MELYSYRNFCGLTLRVGCTDKYLTSLVRVDKAGEDNPTPLSDRVFAQLGEYFAGTRREFDIPFRTNGSEFRERVWKTLCEIPYGETRSYREIAAAIGDAKACRAVGGANHANPICIIIPCHRVVNADRTLGGYGGGLDMKEILLEIERKNKNV